MEDIFSKQISWQIHFLNFDFKNEKLKYQKHHIIASQIVLACSDDNYGFSFLDLYNEEYGAIAFDFRFQIVFTFSCVAE